MDGCHGNFVISDVKLQMLKFCAKIKEYFYDIISIMLYNAAGSETSSEKQWTEIHSLLIGQFGYINIHTWLRTRLWEKKTKEMNIIIYC